VEGSFVAAAKALRLPAGENSGAPHAAIAEMLKGL
jgi:hypothetical protein